MGWFDRLLGQAPMSLPKIEAIGSKSMPRADWSLEQNPLAGSMVFEDLTDPRLAVFLGGGRATAAGVFAGEHQALRNSTFFRAVSLIASAVGMLPTLLMRQGPDGNREEATDHPLYGVLKRRPNAYQTAMEFKSFMQSTALLDGNAYALVVRRPASGKITGLIPFKRGTIEPLLSDDCQLTFRYSKPSGGQAILEPQDVFHFRSMISLDGVRGLGLLDVAAQAIGIAIQAENAAGRVFRNGMMAGGALVTDKVLGDDSIERLRQQLKERYSGTGNAGEWMVLEEGLKPSPLVGSLKEQQNLETRQRQAEELSRFTGAPRPLLMFDETSWGTGVATLGQFFVTYCLNAWFVAWEQAIERCLVDAEQGVLIPWFDAGELLRGSLLDQATFWSKALGNTNAWAAQNEARHAFNMNRKPGADDLPAGGKPAPTPDPTPAPAPKPPKDPADG